MAENDFKTVLAKVAAKAAEAAQAGTPEAARTALAGLVRELAAAIEALPAPAATAVVGVTPTVKNGGIEVVKKNDNPPAAAPTGEEAFFKRLVETHALLSQGPWPFDPEDYAFLERGTDIFKAMSDADRAGEKMTKTIAAAVARLDSLVEHSFWMGSAGPTAKLKDVRHAGAALLVLRGVSAPADPVAVAPGPHPSQQELHRLCGEAASNAKIPAALRTKIAAAIKTMARYHDEMASADEDKRNVMLRYSLNEVTPHEAFLGTEASRRILQILAKAGINEILVPIGQTFDDSYSPSKYDRRKVQSREPRNTIVQVLQRGFLNKEGVCIQKALVAISSGD